jgi:hypothetical protein
MLHHPPSKKQEQRFANFKHKKTTMLTTPMNHTTIATFIMSRAIKNYEAWTSLEQTSQVAMTKVKTIILITNLHTNQKVSIKFNQETFMFSIFCICSIQCRYIIYQQS